jgi:hypothetical protein
VGYVKGMQAEQTIACIKHYAVNNQEKDRGSIDVQVDERPLRKIYLPAFEAGAREGGALAVMGAYNKLRGEHACQTRPRDGHRQALRPVLPRLSLPGRAEGRHVPSAVSPREATRPG